MGVEREDTDLQMDWRISVGSTQIKINVINVLISGISDILQMR